MPLRGMSCAAHDVDAVPHDVGGVPDVRRSPPHTSARECCAGRSLCNVLRISQPPTTSRQSEGLEAEVGACCGAASVAPHAVSAQG